MYDIWIANATSWVIKPTLEYFNVHPHAYSFYKDAGREFFMQGCTGQKGEFMPNKSVIVARRCYGADTITRKSPFKSH
jgi:hypothetical protein